MKTKEEELGNLDEAQKSDENNNLKQYKKNGETLTDISNNALKKIISTQMIK